MRFRIRAISLMSGSEKWFEWKVLALIGKTTALIGKITNAQSKAHLLGVEDLVRPMHRAIYDYYLGQSGGSRRPPRHIQFGIHPADLKRLEAQEQEIEHKLVKHAANRIRELGYLLQDKPIVDIVMDPSAEAGRPSAVVLEKQGQIQHATPSKETLPQQPLVPAQDLPPAWVRLQRGSGYERDIPITRSLILIGRDLDNELVINDPSVSRQHAEIAYEYNHYVLHPLKSRNGTFLIRDSATKRIEPQTECILRNGDVLMLGDFEIEFVTRHAQQ